MLTKRELIQQAFEEIGLGSYAYNAKAEDFQTGLVRLNALLAEWAGTGAVTDGDTTGGLDADSDVPLDAERGVICALAQEIAPSYGKQPLPHTIAAARQGRILMIRIGSTIPQRQVDFTSVPAGSGYKEPIRPFLYPETE